MESLISYLDPNWDKTAVPAKYQSHNEFELGVVRVLLSLWKHQKAGGITAQQFNDIFTTMLEHVKTQEHVNNFPNSSYNLSKRFQIDPLSTAWTNKRITVDGEEFWAALPPYHKWIPFLASIIRTKVGVVSRKDLKQFVKRNTAVPVGFVDDNWDRVQQYLIDNPHSTPEEAFFSQIPAVHPYTAPTKAVEDVLSSITTRNRQFSGSGLWLFKLVNVLDQERWVPDPPFHQWIAVMIVLARLQQTNDTKHSKQVLRSSVCSHTAVAASFFDENIQGVLSFVQSNPTPTRKELELGDIPLAREKDTEDIIIPETAGSVPQGSIVVSHQDLWRLLRSTTAESASLVSTRQQHGGVLSACLQQPQPQTHISNATGGTVNTFASGAMTGATLHFGGEVQLDSDEIASKVAGLLQPGVDGLNQGLQDVKHNIGGLRSDFDEHTTGLKSSAPVSVRKNFEQAADNGARLKFSAVEQPSPVASVPSVNETVSSPMVETVTNPQSLTSPLAATKGDGTVKEHVKTAPNPQSLTSPLAAMKGDGAVKERVETCTSPLVETVTSPQSCTSPLTAKGGWSLKAHDTSKVEPSAVELDKSTGETGENTTSPIVATGKENDSEFDKEDGLVFSRHDNVNKSDHTFSEGGSDAVFYSPEAGGEKFYSPAAAETAATTKSNVSLSSPKEDVDAGSEKFYDAMCEVEPHVDKKSTKQGDSTGNVKPRRTKTDNVTAEIKSQIAEKGIGDEKDEAIDDNKIEIEQNVEKITKEEKEADEKDHGSDDNEIESKQNVDTRTKEKEDEGSDDDEIEQIAETSAEEKEAEEDEEIERNAEKNTEEDDGGVEAGQQFFASSWITNAVPAGERTEEEYQAVLAEQMMVKKSMNPKKQLFDFTPLFLAGTQTQLVPQLKHESPFYFALNSLIPQISSVLEGHKNCDLFLVLCKDNFDDGACKFSVPYLLGICCPKELRESGLGGPTRFVQESGSSDSDDVLKSFRELGLEWEPAGLLIPPSALRLDLRDRIFYLRCRSTTYRRLVRAASARTLETDEEAESDRTFSQSKLFDCRGSVAFPTQASGKLKVDSVCFDFVSSTGKKETNIVFYKHHDRAESFLDSYCDGDQFPEADRPMLYEALKAAFDEKRKCIEGDKVKVFEGVSEEQQQLLEQVSTTKFYPTNAPAVFSRNLIHGQNSSLFPNSDKECVFFDD